MFDVPRQVNTNRLIACMASALLCAALWGCASSTGSRAPWRALAEYPLAGGGSLTMYGDLADKLPHARRSTSLSRFLYGPHVGRAIHVRSAQGMAAVNGQLLLCDQGQLTVLRLDLSTGSAYRLCAGGAWAALSGGSGCGRP